jgi:putative sigma-54 modulation protein
MKTEVRTQTLELTPPMRRQVHQRVREALERFTDRVHTVVVRLEDQNGPRGGVDKRCRIRLRGPQLSIVLEHRHSDAHEALVRVLRRAVRALARRSDVEGGRPPRLLRAGCTS